ncbi:lysylphosphatidylglycerol synthase domain-containing protein [Tunturiibacter gelidiferens]|uniref:lysylphosphatidylglycerol synthase domain-containing protein n=1 Tax=Tunturiibacter gelidiferens TaxID=3069689 RepID=UPI003D9AFEE0
MAFRAATAISGIALLACLIWRVGPGSLLENISTLGWGLALIVALGGVAHLVKTWAWRLTLTGGRGGVSFTRMLQLRLASEAPGQAGALGLMFGEGLRVSALGSKIPIDSRISSVTLDRAMFIASGAIVSLVGTVAALLVISLPHALRLYAVLFAVTLFGLLSVVALAMLNRWRFVSRSARVFCRLAFLRHRLETKLPLVYSVEKKLFDFHRYTPGLFWASLALNLVCHGMAVLEVYLVLWLMGVKIAFFGALAFEALTKLVNAVGVFNPANVGSYEGGNMIIAKMLGLTGAVGLSVAVARRLRAIFWAAVGGLCLFLLSKSKAHGNSGESSKGVAKTPQSRVDGEEANPRFTTIIVANAFRGAGEAGSPLMRVGELPVPLRNILSVQKSVGSRIIVCVDPTTRSHVESELMGTGRLPYSVGWLKARSDTPLSRLLKQIASESGDDQMMLVEGNSVYHPALFRQAKEWSKNSDALALTANDQPIGIYALSADMALAAAKHCPSEVCSLDQLHAWLISTHSAECKPVDGSLWQRVLTLEDRAAAEAKLDRWLVKPTDGIFARMNRRISVPISRQLIKFPITPNMVSMFTLGVGVASGAFFACGGYWNVLAGAVLSVWASILDGCDGEVARLKLLESDFGCWLETVCDYLYYLLIFAGMAIGLIRTSDESMYLTWGILLLCGAVMSFLVTGLGRHRLATGRPEQYLRIWQAKAEGRRSNPILYFGRYTEFIVRRCFMPYVLLFFAVFNITKVVFFLAAIGANVVWLISLYSYCAFAFTRRSPIRKTAAVPSENSA